MQLNIYKDYQALSDHTAEAILATVKTNPTAVLCFASGDTPRLTYELMAKKARNRNVDFTGCAFIGLDEWVGIPPQDAGSCRFFLEHQIFKPLNIQSSVCSFTNHCIKFQVAQSSSVRHIFTTV